MMTNKLSITDDWKKEIKLVGNETLTLFKLNDQVMGITASQNGDTGNESWTFDGCCLLEEVGEMKFKGNYGGIA